MKSQEYFDKYFLTVKDGNELLENSKAMLREMLGEFEAIKTQRKVSTVSGIVGIVRELNERWNSVAYKVEKKFSAKLLKRNVIWNMVLADKFSEEFPRKPD